MKNEINERTTIFSFSIIHFINHMTQQTKCRVDLVSWLILHDRIPGSNQHPWRHNASKPLTQSFGKLIIGLKFSKMNADEQIQMTFSFKYVILRSMIGRKTKNWKSNVMGHNHISYIVLVFIWNYIRNWAFLEGWIWIWIWRFDRIWIWIWTLLDLPAFVYTLHTPLFPLNLGNNETSGFVALKIMANW